MVGRGVSDSAMLSVSRVLHAVSTDVSPFGVSAEAPVEAFPRDEDGGMIHETKSIHKCYINMKTSIRRKPLTIRQTNKALSSFASQ